MLVISYLFLIIAALMDLKTGKIPNWLNALFWLLIILKTTVDSGFKGIFEILMITIISFGIYIGLYICKALGAGDVKLIIVLTCYWGIVKSLKITFISMILTIIYVLLKKGIKVIFHKDTANAYLTVKMAPFIALSVMVLQLYSYISN